MSAITRGYLDAQEPARSPSPDSVALPRGEFRIVDPRDPIAAPLLHDLEREYDTRYGTVGGDSASAEMNRYPAELFLAPVGAFVVLIDDDQVVAGGAFMRYDDRTAEFKRIWTRTDHRGRGLGKRVLVELEARARALGYSDVFLTTGPRQPEAVALYRSAGYTHLYTPEDDVQRGSRGFGVHGFGKPLGGDTP